MKLIACVMVMILLLMPVCFAVSPLDAFSSIREEDRSYTGKWVNIEDSNFKFYIPEQWINISKLDDVELEEGQKFLLRYVGSEGYFGVGVFESGENLASLINFAKTFLGDDTEKAIAESLEKGVNNILGNLRGIYPNSFKCYVNGIPFACAPEEDLITYITIDLNVNNEALGYVISIAPTNDLVSAVKMYEVLGTLSKN